MTEVVHVDVEQASTEQLMAAMYRAGSLRHMLQPHQLEDYDAMRAWNEERQTKQHLRWVAEIGALFDNMWVDECGRRHGKTVKWLLTDVEEMIRRPGARGMIATPLQKSIGGIIVPLTKMLFKDSPPEYFPKYVGSKDSDHQGLYIAATDSFCKLVGLDKHPDATRGQFLDFCHITEAAFVKGLDELITAVIMPQFRYRPWAWLALESSTAKAPDCDFNRIFREDAKLRGTYRKHGIRDNTSLTDEEIEQEYRRSGGRQSPRARRELDCEEVRDADEMIVPEFDEAVHVVDPGDWPRPRHALAHVGLDPGVTDPFGLVWLYFDWARQCIVVEGSWQRANASTGEVVRVTHDFEGELWGASHRAAGERRRELSIRDVTLTGDGKAWEAPSAALTYWDAGEYTLKPNPYSRVSDIANRFILDMNTDYGMNVRPAEKSPGSKEADTEYLRTLFSARPVRIVVLRNGRTQNIIEQLRSGMWNTDEVGHRTDWQRSKTLGHCDCLIAGTMVATARGDVPIDQVRVGDYAWTRVGLRRVSAAWLVGSRETWTVETSLGTLTGTAEHRVRTTRGWKHLAELSHSDTLCGWESTADGSRWFSTASPTVGTRTASFVSTASTSAAEGGRSRTTCIETSGDSTTGQSLMGWMSTTLTRTLSTTTSAISSFLAAASTLAGTILKRHQSQSPSVSGTTSAASAGSSALPRSHARSSAAAFADRNGAANPGETTSKRSASNAASDSSRIDTRVPSTVRAAVRSVQPTGRVELVYDLTVEGKHEFFANGVLVHNCLAALKYVVRDVNWQRNPNVPAHVLDPQMPDHHVPTEVRERASGGQVMPTFGGRGRHAFNTNSQRTFR